MKCLFYLLLFCITVTRLLAQTDGSVKGSLRDTVTHGSVADATVTVLNMRDSSLVSFSRSTGTGTFQVGRLPKGAYRLLISHVSYRNASRNFVITEQEKEVNLGVIVLADKASMLDAVTVQQEAPPVVVRNDTVEYNAGSFHTRPNAVVEDLLKRLPGVQVDKDGNIKAQGKEVKKVLVDGKEFFGTDPKIATRNLPADVVDKVQVFDKKSDQSQFTGFDDGNSEKTVNVTIKKDKKHGVFGRMTAGGGDGRYETQFSVNQFKGEQQLSALGMWNNTNKQGFSFKDAMGFNGGGSMGGGRLTLNLSGGVPIQGMGQGSQAITTTRGGGLNFNDSWGGKVDAGGNYFYNGADDRVRQMSNRQYLFPQQSYNQAHTESTDRHNENQRINFFIDTKLDSLNSLKFTNSLTYQRSSSRTTAIDSSRSKDDGALLNTGASRTAANGNGYTWSSTALFRHRFLKKGRTFSANLSWGQDHNTGDGKLYAVNQFFKSGGADTLDQVYDQKRNGNNYGATLSYTEPLSKKSLLEANYQFFRSHSFSGKETFNADGNGKYTLPNLQQTNDIWNTYMYHREGMSFRHQRANFNVMFGAVLQQASYSNVFGYSGKDSSLHQTFQSLLPHGQLQYDVNKYRHLQLQYQTNTNPPSLTQLQTVPDNSDPLNIKEGNPGLLQEYNHNVSMNYAAFDPFRRTSFFGMLNYSGTRHRIVNDDRVNSAGVRTSRPVNLDGLYRAGGFLSWDLPLRAIRGTMMSFKSDVQYDHNASLVNGDRNNGNTWTIGQEAGFQFTYKDALDINGRAKATYNDARYSLQAGQNMHYWTETYSLDGNWWITKAITLSSDVDYTHRSGLPAGYNSSPLVWNAGIGARVLKNQRGLFQLQVNDILKQNTGFSRNTSQNYIEDVSYRVLNRYWLLTFTYNFNRFAGKAVGSTGQGRAPDIKILR